MSRSLAVVIPNYNYGRYLGFAIDSLLRQTVPIDEIIVVDDGSTDNSRDVITSYGDRIRPIFQPNGGQRSAYNSGFLATTSDLVLFLDADDTLEDHAVEAIKNSWTVAAAKLHFPLRIVSRDGKDTGSYVPFQPLPEGNLVSALLREGYYVSPPASGNVYARIALEQILPLDESLKYGADMPTVHLAPFMGEVLAIRQPLGSYRVHGSNHDIAATVTQHSILAALRSDAERSDLLLKAANARGMIFNPDVFHRQIQHLKLRLAASRLGVDEKGHPLSNRWAVAFRGARAVLRNRKIKLAKRLMLSAWFFALAASPKGGVPYLLQIGFSASSRPKLAVKAASQAH